MNSPQSIDFGIAGPPSKEASFVVELSRHSGFWIVGCGVIALVLKMVISLNALGTNDVQSFYVFGHSLSEHGLQWTYAHYKSFNHPPLVAYFLRAIYTLSNIPLFQQNGFTFPFLLRFPGIIADFIVVLLLLQFRTEFSLPTSSLMVLALSPVTLMVSGFHGNTDSVMIMFLVLAACMCLRERSILCGLFLALSCQIKIIPLLLLPIFACFWYSRRATLRFFVPFAAACILLCLVPVITFPVSFIKNVVAYGSIWGLWGISFWLRLTGIRDFCLVDYHDLTLAENIVGTALKALIVAGVIVLAWRRRNLSGYELYKSIAYAWIVFFLLTPGAAAQYMAWMVPFVILLSPTMFVCLTLSSSVFLFVFYNTLAGKFPWYLAVSTPALADRIAPWALWPWAVLICIIALSWKRALQDPSSSLQPSNVAF